MTDTPAQNPAPEPARIPQEQMSALIAKHADQINAIFAIADPVEQMKAVEALGIDAKKIEAQYQPLQDRSDELKALEKVADKKTFITGLASFAAGAAGMFALAKKHIPNPLIKWTAVVLGAAGISVAARFIASRVFSGGIREESKQLVIQAAGGLKRELAVALENRETDALMSKEQGGAPQSGFSENTPQRDASFAAQSASEKAAAQGAGQART